MSPRDQLDLYYLRYPRVAQQFGERFLPLIERALKARAEVGARILQLVESSFEKEQARRNSELALQRDMELRVLQVVAGVLHGWDPPEWLEKWPT
jgi:hypothetical protein